MSGITYVSTEEGWLYVSCTMNLFSRKVVGLCMGEKLSVDLVENTLKKAICHRGSQYTSEDFEKLAQDSGMKLSMSGKGNCYDNAVIESFFHTLNTEHVYQHKFSNREEAKRSVPYAGYSTAISTTAFSNVEFTRFAKIGFLRLISCRASSPPDSYKFLYLY